MSDRQLAIIKSELRKIASPCKFTVETHSQNINGGDQTIKVIATWEVPTDEYWDNKMQEAGSGQLEILTDVVTRSDDE